jgi:hypothetical protein
MKTFRKLSVLLFALMMLCTLCVATPASAVEDYFVFATAAPTSLPNVLSDYDVLPDQARASTSDLEVAAVDVADLSQYSVNGERPSGAALSPKPQFQAPMQKQFQAPTQFQSPKQFSSSRASGCLPGRAARLDRRADVAAARRAGGCSDASACADGSSCSGPSRTVSDAEYAGGCSGNNSCDGQGCSGGGRGLLRRR